MVNKMDKIPCLRGAYILVAETRKHRGVNYNSLESDTCIEKNKAGKGGTGSAGAAILIENALDKVFCCCCCFRAGIFFVCFVQLIHLQFTVF